jgi:hypothetical protein
MLTPLRPTPVRTVLDDCGHVANLVTLKLATQHATLTNSSETLTKTLVKIPKHAESQDAHYCLIVTEWIHTCAGSRRGRVCREDEEPDGSHPQGG